MSETTKTLKNIADIYPLSPMQEGVLFHSLLDPRAGVHLMQNRYLLEGEIDHVAFRRAWQQVVDRHDILRTSFVWEDQKRPLQIVHKQVVAPVIELDWRDHPPVDQKRELEALLKEELKNGFDFAQAPLLRLRLIRMTDRTYRFIQSYHLILMDAWCFSLFMKDFFDFYAVQVQGEDITSLQPRPYREYIAWLQRQDIDAAENFWRDYLQGFVTPTPLGMKAHVQRPSDDSTDMVADQVTHLPACTTTTLLALAQQHQLTLNTFVQGAWALILNGYSGERDIVFGVTVAGRPPELDGVESIIGLFINSLPLRVSVFPETRLLDWLKALLAQNVRMRQYEYAPLVRIQGWSEAPRGQPLFDSLFVFENAPVDPSLMAQTLPFDIQTEGNRTHTNYPLTVVILPGEELGLQLTYDRQQFDDRVIARMLEQFRYLLEQMAQQQHTCLGDLTLLPPTEKQQVTVTWNQTATAYPAEQSVADLFEAQMARTPDEVAVRWGAESITYAELNHRAEQVARALVAADVGSDAIIAVLTERSIDLVVLMLGIFKAGASYLPLDPQHPEARWRQILKQGSVSLLLTTEAFQRRVIGAMESEVWDTSVQVRTLESFASVHINRPQSPRRTHPSQLAYVIYTSGSTGVPKGAMVTQQGMVNNVWGKIPTVGLTAFDVVAQTASHCFDISIWQCLSALLCGGRVEILADDIVRDPPRLLAELVRTGATVVELVPSLLREVLAVEPPVALPALRWLLPTGEAMTPELCRVWFERYPSIPLLNAYGPAECADDVAYYAITSAPPVEDLGVPIGRPAANLQLYILSPDLQPVSIGVTGEICIGGAGVGRGYLHEATRTAESFVPHPYAQTPGARLYRTGDLGRYRTDGNIDFIGRRDQQVKVRGVRIELGEIEAALAAVPGVRDQVVVVRDDRPGQLQLVAYVVGEGEGSVETVRSALRETLPDYMVPTLIVPLAALPLTPNGKVDRQALPAPEMGWLPTDRYEAPQTSMEEVLAGIWAEVLGVSRIGRHDNFFDLGGHSLLATQVMARVRSVLRVELPLRTLFEARTVAQLAEAIESASFQAGDMEVPPVSRVERDGPMPLSFAQQRLWVLAQLDPDGASYNIPIALRLSGTLDVAALERSVNELIHRHEVLRTTVSLSDGQPVQVVALTSAMSVPVVTLDYLDPSEREAAVLRLTTADAQRPFELAYGPMLRVTLLRLDAEEHVLLLTMHHIVSDGWSSHILVQEMTELYIAQVQGRPASLPELPIQYADFAIWQRQWLAGVRLDRHLDYWKERLAGVLEPLTLPMDHPRPPVQTSRGAALTLSLSSELSSAMAELSRREGATLFMTLLAAFYILLFRYTGRTDLVVGSPIANRIRSEIEGLIGFFVNTLALRTNVSGNPTVRDVLERVRDTCLGAYTHQDVPFEKLVEVLQPVRDVSYSPIFQVMFELQNAPASELVVPGLRISDVEVETLTAKFDLTLSMCETEDGLTASMEYNIDLFDASTIQRMLRHYELILQDMAARPYATIDEVRLLTGEEELRLLIEWNAGLCQSIPDRSFSQLFEAQVLATPDSVAAVWLDQRMTYHELNRRANRVAHALRLNGVEPETVVALLGDRDLDFLPMLLGIFKVGGIYLPLDTGHPDHRLAHMLGESCARVLLTTETYRQRVKPLTEGLAENTRLILLMMDRIQSSVKQDCNLGTPWHAAQTVYVIYTSGSTGVPKGAIVEHRGMLNHLWGKVMTLRLTAADVIAQTASQCFDISVWQFLAPLLCGGQVCIVPDEIAHDPARLLRHVEAAGVTLLETVPALLQGMLDMAADTHDREPALKRLRMILSTGEALPGLLCRRWLARYPSVPLINAYGPAECADDVALHQISRIPEEQVASMPVGRPVPNLELYVLSPSLKPLPVGAAGELCVAGVGVGRGYLFDSAKTAEVFVPHPFAKEPGARLYRTGDMAHYLPNGVIQFIGRMDHQVKVRGFRIELGEIESQLLEHPDVHETVVVAKEDARGDKRLVAYVAGNTSGESLREFLRERLPEYMVPSVIVILDSLPRNANGKVDRRALPEPTGRNPQQTFVAPRTDMEARFTREWAEVLGLPQVGIHDNFFDLGGHSLTAVQVVSRTQRMIGNPISLLDLFQAPTVAGLAERISGQAKATSSPFVVLQAGRGGTPLFCFDPTGTHVTAYQSLTYALGEDRPVYGLALSWIFSEPWRALSMDLIAARYAAIICERQPDGPYHLLGWSNGGAIALAVGRLLEQQGQSLAFLGILDTQPQVASEPTVSVAEELNYYIQGDRKEAFLALPDTDRQALKDELAQLGEEDRVEHAIRWAQDRKLLSREESDASVATLKVGYALDRETARILFTATQDPMQAPIHAWWTSTTLNEHGNAPIDWRLYTTGTVETATVIGDHTDGVQSIQVHHRISEILTDLTTQNAHQGKMA